MRTIFAATAATLLFGSAALAQTSGPVIAPASGTTAVTPDTDDDATGTMSGSTTGTATETPAGGPPPQKAEDAATDELEEQDGNAESDENAQDEGAETKSN